MNNRRRFRSTLKWSIRPWTSGSEMDCTNCSGAARGSLEEAVAPMDGSRQSTATSCLIGLPRRLRASRAPRRFRT